MTDLNTRIGTRIRQLRTAQDLSLEALAERAGVSRSMISLIERGGASPTAVVLERLATDSFAGIFLEPVDPEDFPDYEEMIDNPMDLGTIRTKLETKKYQAPEQFARDMRRVRIHE